MSALGDFLETFYSPRLPFRTVHARVQHTKKTVPAESTASRELVFGRRRRDVKPPDDSVESLSFWGRLPDQVRVETTRVKEGKTETTIEVVNGESAWKRHDNGVVEQGSSSRHSSDAISLPTQFQRHFDRRLLRECFAALTLEAIGMCQVAGCDCLRIRAVRVPGIQLWPHWLAWAASEFEFAADVERAVLLSIVGHVDGKTIETHEVREVTFDGEIDETLFVYQPGANEIVQSTVPVAEHITLEAAVG